MRRGAMIRVGALLTMVTLAAAPAQAQLKKKKAEVYVPKKVKTAKVRDIGWDGSLTIGASISLSSSSKVVGQADGETISLTGQITGGLDYIKGMHEWRNTLKLSETSAKTPGIDRFVKTNDLLSLDSLYLLHIKQLKWFGPYARFQAQTRLFPTEDVRAGLKDDGSTVNYQLKDANDSLPDGTATGDSFRLANAFSPTTFRETLGAFAKPFTRDWLMVEFKTGFQAKQTLVRGNTFSVDDQSDTDAIDLVRINDVSQAGPSAGVLLKGKIYQNKVSYFVDAEAMFPVVNDYEGELSTGELTNIIVDAGVSVKVFSWMSLDYTFRLLREPQLVDVTQVQNNILLTFAYTFLDSAQNAKPAKK